MPPPTPSPPPPTNAMSMVMLDATKYPRAICMDGTRAAYTFRAATSEESKHLWIIHLQKGGMCSSQSSCDSRCGQYGWAKSSGYGLCGSGNFPSEWKKEGVFNSEHPYLKHANKIYVPYCTSDAHWADTEMWGYYMRGKVVVESVIKEAVETHGLGMNSTHKDTLLFGGSSAGSRGAMAHLDYVHEMLGPQASPNVKVYGFLDSPMWLDRPSLPEHSTDPTTFRQGVVQDAYNNFNLGDRAGPKCMAAYPQNEWWKCYLGQYRVPLLNTTATVVADQYDSYLISEDLYGHSGGGCPTTQSVCDAYMDNGAALTRSIMKDAYHNSTSYAPTSVWSSSCTTHARATSSMQGFDGAYIGTDTFNTMARTVIDMLRGYPRAYIETCTSNGCGGASCNPSTATPIEMNYHLVKVRKVHVGCGYALQVEGHDTTVDSLGTASPRVLYAKGGMLADYQASYGTYWPRVYAKSMMGLWVDRDVTADVKLMEHTVGGVVKYFLTVNNMYAYQYSMDSTPTAVTGAAASWPVMMADGTTMDSCVAHSPSPPLPFGTPPIPVPPPPSPVPPPPHHPTMPYLCIDNYYPLFTNQTQSNLLSPSGSSHTHVFGGVTYYMPDGFAGNMHNDQGACPSSSLHLSPSHPPPITPLHPPPHPPPSPISPPPPPTGTPPPPHARRIRRPVVSPSPPVDSPPPPPLPPLPLPILLPPSPPPPPPRVLQARLQVHPRPRRRLRLRRLALPPQWTLKCQLCGRDADGGILAAAVASATETRARMLRYRSSQEHREP